MWSATSYTCLQKFRKYQNGKIFKYRKNFGTGYYFNGQKGNNNTNTRKEKLQKLPTVTEKNNKTKVLNTC